MAAHPWLSIKSHPILLDILIYKPPFKLDALKVLSKALTENEFIYLRFQIMLLEPNKDEMGMYLLTTSECLFFTCKLIVAFITLEVSLSRTGYS
ncbi:putative non-specific serine/threonine protein kinase [Helianthus anomalus]